MVKSRAGRIELLALVVLAGILFLRSALTTKSLWVDETISYWIVKDSLADVFHRALNYQGQSPWYFSILWCFEQLLGPSEWRLRLPTALFMLAAAYYVYALASRWTNAEVGCLSAVYMLCLMHLLPEEQSARPYGLAILSVAASWCYFDAWLRHGRRIDQILFIFWTVSAVYSHCLFGLSLFFLPLIFLNVRKSTKVDLTSLFASAGVFFVLMCPLLYQLFLLMGKRELYSFSAIPSMPALLNAWNPARFVTCWAELAVPLLLLDHLFHKAENRPTSRILFGFGLLVWLLPALWFYLLSHATQTALFVGRYFAWYAIGLALSCAALGARSTAVARFGLGIIPIYIAFAYLSPWEYVDEDWRAASLAINSRPNHENSLLLLWPGLVEAGDLIRIKDPEQRSFLSAPISRYPVNARTLLLPWDPKLTELEAYLSSGEISELKSTEDLVLLTRSIRADRKGSPYETQNSDQYLENWLATLGFSKSGHHRFGGVTVTEFTTASPTKS